MVWRIELLGRLGRLSGLSTHGFKWWVCNVDEHHFVMTITDNRVQDRLHWKLKFYELNLPLGCLFF